MVLAVGIHRDVRADDRGAGMTTAKASAVLVQAVDDCRTCGDARQYGGYDRDDLVAMPDNHGRWVILCVECLREADPRLPTL